MKFFNFYSKFEKKILDNTKTSTIRKNNYQKIKIGDNVQLKCGDRLLKEVKITQIFNITFKKDSIVINGDILTEEKVEKLTKLEGYLLKDRELFRQNLVDYLGLDQEGKLFIWN